MDKKITAVAGAGIILTVIFFFISPYLGGIAAIILAVVVMSIYIMQDTACIVQVDARLREDAKAIILKNSGNSPAKKIHVALVPLNKEYDLDSLAADASHEYPLESMITEVRVILTYENEKGQHSSKSCRLSSSEEEFDPLKPMIPVFGWK